jgi:hypothetical protein
MLKNLPHSRGVAWLALRLLIGGMIALNSHGAVLLQEDWNSGRVDTNRWEVVGWPINSTLANLGNGDWAVQLQDIAKGNAYNMGIRSRFGIPRGDNLRCTFRMWRDRQPVNWNGIGGPFANRNYPAGQSPNLAQIEAGFSRYAPISGNPGLCWAEGVERFLNSGPRVEAAFQNAWVAATNKPLALWVRVWLGNTTGAKCQWSPDGTNWQTLKLAGGVPIDTIGLPAGSNWGAVYSGENAACSVGAKSPVWIYFGGGGSGVTYIDDIQVANDAATWSPPPTPPPPPRPADVITLDLIQPRGHYYQATVPDTLDLAERARLAVHGLTSFLDPAMNYAPWGHFAFDNATPALLDRAGGPPNWGKIAEAIIRTRVMCGSTEGLDTELRSLKGMIEYLTPDTINPIAPCPISRAMIALNWLYQFNPNPALGNLINAYSHAHLSAAKNKDDYSYYNESQPYGLIGYGDHPHDDGTALRAITFWGTTIGDARCLALAGRLTRGLMLPAFWAPEVEPKVVVPADRAHFYGHMHSYLCALMGMAWYADAARDAQTMDFVRAGYEYERNFGLARVGLFGEGCTSGDMTQVAIRLSESGAADYWEDVDSYLRNHLTEIQLTDAAQLRQATSTMNGTYADNYAAADRDYTDVITRIIGTVTDDSSHLTRVPQVSAVSTICGPGNVTSALCYAWDAIVRCTNGDARVQLLLNRASPWMDIDSYLPFEGKVIIRNKTAHRLSVRIPRWVNKAAVQIHLGPRRATPSWLDHYAILDAIRPGERITITFPMLTTTEHYTLKWKPSEMWQESTDPGRDWTNSSPITYTMTFKGNTLVDVTPRDPGQGLPLYQRTAMLQGTEAPMKTVTRFVADTARSSRPIQTSLSPPWPAMTPNNTEAPSGMLKLSLSAGRYGIEK